MKPFIPREWIRMRKQPEEHPWSRLSSYKMHMTIKQTSKGPYLRVCHTIKENPIPDGVQWIKAPYSPGEVYWVRETWRHIANSSHPGMPVEAVIQYSDMAIKYRGSWPDFANAPKEAWWNTGKQPWRSPVTMPQWAARRHVRIISCVPEQRGEWGWKIEWEEVKK